MLGPTSLHHFYLHPSNPSRPLLTLPSSRSDGGHDVDSSTELWDEPEEDQPHCAHCSTSLHDQYTDSLRGKLKQQQITLIELKVLVWFNICKQRVVCYSY